MKQLAGHFTMLNKLLLLWISLFYLIINATVYPFFLVWPLIYWKTFKKNKSLTTKISNETAYILLNGPSVESFDVRSLRQELTICANHAHRTKIYEALAPTGPKFHCAIDNNFFDLNSADQQRKFETLISQKHIHFIFNQNCPERYWHNENINIVFTKHLPTFLNVRYKITSRMSSFSNVAVFCLAFALSLGVKRIVLIGLDFHPGVFRHTYDDDEQRHFFKGQDISAVFAWNMGYLRSQLEFYMLQRIAAKKGVEILNANPDSAVRAFDYLPTVNLSAK